MHYSEKMLEIGQALENLGHQFICSKFVNNFIGKNDDEKEEILHRREHLS